MESRIFDLIYVLAFAAAFQLYIAIAGAIVIYGPCLVKRIRRKIKSACRERQRIRNRYTYSPKRGTNFEKG
jgi:hypothetical protein